MSTLVSLNPPYLTSVGEAYLFSTSLLTRLPDAVTSIAPQLIQAVEVVGVEMPETAVIVSLDDQEIGRFTASDAWQTYTFPVPISSTKQPHAELRFTSETFIPAELHLNNDLRELGFLIDWIKITSEP